MGFFARLIVGVMGLMSVASLLVASERLFHYGKQRKESQAFAEKMAALLAEGDVDTAAITKVPGEVGYLGRVIDAGLKAYRDAPKGFVDFSFESVARALERQTQREVQSLRRGHSLLATVASTAPFVGLLGTVVGIVNAFKMMAESGSGGLATISAGIAEALVTTAFGLLVAIPAVMAANFLQTWVEARTVDITESANELLDLVARRLKTAG
jgi:biopolymer transport protein ExbB/biopolymer transport protein TolQ